MHTREQWAELTPEDKVQWAQGVIDKGAPKKPGLGSNLLAAALTGGSLGGFAGAALKGGKGAAIGSLIGTVSQLPLWAAIQHERHEREAKAYAGEAAKSWNTIKKYAPDDRRLQKAAQAMVRRVVRKGKRKEAVLIDGQEVDVKKIEESVAGKRHGRVSLKTIDDSNLKRSKKTGYKKSRQDKVPLDKPVLLVGNQLLDGRHRYFKAKDSGRRTLPAIRVTKSDLRKAASRLTEGKETSLARDFAAGVDPTGSATFSAALRNRKNHAAHQAAGVAGGFVAGSTVIPSVTLGLIGAMKTPGGIAARGRGFAQGAMKPFRKIIDSHRTSKVLDRAARTGVLSVDKAEAASGNRMFQGVSRLVKRQVKQPKIFRKPLEAGGSRKIPDSARETMRNMAESVRERRSEGLGLLAAGGGINAGASLYQYSTGQKMQKILDEESGRKAKKPGTP